jgi:hypothetical protein
MIAAVGSGAAVAATRTWDGGRALLSQQQQSSGSGLDCDRQGLAGGRLHGMQVPA